MEWTAPFVLAIFVLILLYFMNFYNRLKKNKADIKVQWEEISLFFQKKYAILVLLTDKIQTMESGFKLWIDPILQHKQVAEAANLTLDKQGGPTNSPATLKLLIQAENTLNQNLDEFEKKCFSSPIFQQMHLVELVEELKACENRLSFLKKTYDDTVVSYNKNQKRFGLYWLAALLGHHPLPLIT